MIFVLRHWFWLSCADCGALQLFDALLQLVFRDDCLLEGSLPDAVRQCQLSGQGDITLGDGFATLEGSLGTGGLKDHQIGAVTFHVERGSEGRDGKQVAAAISDPVHQAAGQLNLVGKLFFLVKPLLAELLRILFKGQVALHDQHAFAGFTDAVDFGRMSKAVQQLRAQVAFFGVHRAHEDEARRMSK